MKYTPNNGLPEALYSLLTKDIHVTNADYSVTELISPPRVLQLRRRHDAEIVCDAMDRIWLLFGKLVHGKLEDHAGINSFSEERLHIEVNGVKVSGAPDLYENECIFDYKTTSLYAVKDGLKSEWEKQLNIYAYLFRHVGFPVKALKIVAILKDWSKMQVENGTDYPKEPIVVINVPVWSDVDCLKYIQERVALHEAARVTKDDDLPECTAEERWCRPTKFALMKKGNKRAVKLYATSFEAEVALGDKNDHYIEKRPGESVRCGNYCDGADFCNQYKKSLAIESV